LISQLGRKATSDRLQAMLWPEDEIEVAARKLYLAISALRRSLSDDPASEPSRSYIVCKNRVYALNASVAIQTDVDEFLHCYHTGQRGAAERVTLYEKACQLYTGPFLAEDLYADWSFIQREQLTRAYLTMRNELTDYYLKAGRYEEAAQSAHAVLKENRCDEAAHRHLIQVYIAQGRRSEALQQYARCTSVLHEELGVKPLPETTLAIQALLTNDFPSTQQYRKNIEKT
jgi:DNA-binding SARP family transcriptional activator